MQTSASLLQNLRQILPNLHPQLYFKASLTALSHAMEDLVLADAEDQPLVVANFQQERFYRQEIRRYQRIAQRTDQIYVLAAPDTSFGETATPYITVPLSPDDALAQEWHLVIIGQRYAACLVCREHAAPVNAAFVDQARQFRGIWTFDRQVSLQAARLLLEQVLVYRPELAPQIRQAQQRYGLSADSAAPPVSSEIDARLFTDRLVNYLQANQYKLLRAYRTIAVQAQWERSVNSMTDAIRRSLNSEAVLSIAVRELSRIFNRCRCLFYPHTLADQPTRVDYEFVPPGLPSLRGEIWNLSRHPLFQEAIQEGPIAIADVTQDMGLRRHPALKAELQRWQVRSCLLVPVRYQAIVLGMLELHHCNSEGYVWREEDITLVEAIAAQVGIALMQAKAYANLEVLNTQMAALERTQGNLIAIVGHELRTPLATIQVCLESLESEQALTEMQQVLLQTAIADADRLRQLIQDFLTLSRLESDSVHWHLEPISFQECLDMALSGIRSSLTAKDLPEFALEISASLPPLQADGEGLTQVLSKLIENACKFTASTGKVTIRTQQLSRRLDVTQPVFSEEPFSETAACPLLEVIIADSGRGIEPSRLESIFDRFYQEESFLRRTAGGVGLGLAICRRIVEQMGGQIWAASAGRDQGSQFHFTIPLANPG